MALGVIVVAAGTVAVQSMLAPRTAKGSAMSAPAAIASASAASSPGSPSSTPPARTATSAPAAPASGLLSPPSPTAVISFTSLLTSPTCPAPCSDGIACATAAHRECSSGFTCIAGDRADRLPPTEGWGLFVSAVLEEHGRSACSGSLSTGKVCIQPASSLATTCVPIADACAHGDRSTIPVPVMTEDLTRDPMTIEIKNGAGNVVATRSGVLFADGLRRSSLCVGAKVRAFETEASPTVEALTFFLAPAGESLGGGGRSKQTL